MVKRDEFDDLDSLRKLAVGGALAVKSTDVIRHARDPTALTGDISGFVGIGIAGATSKIAMDMALGKMKRKQKHKRKRR